MRSRTLIVFRSCTTRCSRQVTEIQGRSLTSISITRAVASSESIEGVFKSHRRYCSQTSNDYCLRIGTSLPLSTPPSGN